MNREYQKHEFCKAIGCFALKNDRCRGIPSFLSQDGCHYSAKTFHKWLIDNGFLLIKNEEEYFGKKESSET